MLVAPAGRGSLLYELLIEKIFAGLMVFGALGKNPHAAAFFGDVIPDVIEFCFGFG
jgi:hypothetical protein